MKDLSKKSLLGWVARGLIAGPGESDVAFQERIASLPPVKRRSYTRLGVLFGVVPDWVPLSFSNRGLSFFHGAMTTIDASATSIQVRKKGLLYPEDEVVAHEMVHACRLAFDEPRFEEVLAYQTSRSPLRRFFGPIFQSPWESYLFVASLISLMGLNIATIAYPSSILETAFWVNLGLIFWAVGFGLYRLTRTQRLFKKCRKRFAKMCQSEKKALQLILCLTDAEIVLFAHFSESEIKTHIEREKLSSLRSLQIATLLDDALG